MDTVDFLSNINLLNTNKPNLSIPENTKEFINSIGIQTDRINKLSPSIQVLPSSIKNLNNIEYIKKLNEIRNSITPNKNISNMEKPPSLSGNSITIPSSCSSVQSVGQGIVNMNINTEMNSNALVNSIIPNQTKEGGIPNISVLDDINLYKPKSSFDLTNIRNINNNNNNILDTLKLDYAGIDNFLRTSSMASLNNGNSINMGFSNILNTPNLLSIGNSVNALPGLNSSSTLSLSQTPISINTSNSISLNQIPVSMNSSNSIPISQNPLYLSPILNQNINNTLPMNNGVENQLQLLNLMKLLSNQKIPEGKKNKTNTIGSIIIPTSFPTNENENNSNNYFVNSIIGKTNTENNITRLLNQVQQQQQQPIQYIPSPVLDLNDKNEMNTIIDEEKGINSIKSIPSILISEGLDITNTSTSQISTISNKEELNNDIIDNFLKISLPNKQNGINTYVPLSPALSPVLNSPLLNIPSDNAFENCIKKDEKNDVDLMETLNDLLNISPEIESMNVTKPVENDVAGSINNNTTKNESELPIDNILDDIINSINNQEKEELMDDDRKDNNYLNIDNTYLNIPATPRSISSPSNLSDCDFSEFSNFVDSYDDISIINNVEEILNELNVNKSSNGLMTTFEENEENDISSLNNPIITITNETNDMVKLDIACNNAKNDDSDGNGKVITEANEQLKTGKKNPRGRPRKNKKSENTPLKEKLNKTFKESTDSLLSTELHIQRICSTLSKNNDKNIQTISEATENQYDIQMNNVKDKHETENIFENDLILKSDNENNNCTYLNPLQEVEEDERKCKECEEFKKEEESIVKDYNCKERNIIKDNNGDQTKNKDNDNMKNKIKPDNNKSNNINKNNSETNSDDKEEMTNNNKENIDIDSDEEESLLIRKKEIQQNNNNKRKLKTTIRKSKRRCSLKHKKIDIEKSKNNKKGKKEEKGEEKEEEEKEKEKEEEEEEEEEEEKIPIRNITINKGNRKRKRYSKEDNKNDSSLNKNKKKVIRLSITQIKNNIENGNRLSIGNSLDTNDVSALTKNGLVLVGRKRVIVENTNRPYVCTDCGAGFVRKHDLNRHGKIHSGIKNYKCPYCDRAFSRNDALSRHLKVELKHKFQNKKDKNIEEEM